MPDKLPDELTYYDDVPIRRLTPPARVLIIGAPRSTHRNWLMMQFMQERFEDRGVIVEYDFDCGRTALKPEYLQQPFFIDELASLNIDAWKRLNKRMTFGERFGMGAERLCENPIEKEPTLRLERPKNKPWYGNFDKKRYMK